MASEAFHRPSALARLGSEEFDVLVIGGGVTGCGVALDATARGLRTALVEARDFASGTSSKSSKLIHGGLRYLTQRDYHLVYEALRERQRLIRNAPHLVHPLPFLIPLFGRDGAVAEGVAKAYSTILWLYDVTGGLRIGHRHRRIGADEALTHFPALRTDRLVASFLYWDAQADDARLTLALARTAAARGAAIANYSPVAELVSEGGRVRGARLVDGTTIRARTVVNAGGVWSAEVGGLGGTAGGTISIRPAKGIHITVRSERLPSDFASVLAVPGDKRSIFVVPWAADEASGPSGPGRYTYIGTTDTDYDGSLDDPVCTTEDIDYVLMAVNTWTSSNLTRDDITATWAGLRPLISTPPTRRSFRSKARSSKTADLSRRHRVIVGSDGMVTVTGGKLTTYRQMAADTVDSVCGASPGRVARMVRRVQKSKASPTVRLTLIGGESGGRPVASAAATARRLGINDAVYGHLVGRHGTETPEVLALCSSRPELAETLHPALPYIKAEVVWAARYEMAQTVTDVLARRTRALTLDRAASVEVAHEVAQLLGLDESDRATQVAEFKALVDAELTSEAEAEGAALHP